MLRGNPRYEHEEFGNDILEDLNGLRAEGESLRQKTIRLLRNK